MIETVIDVVSYWRLLIRSDEVRGANRHRLRILIENLIVPAASESRTIIKFHQTKVCAVPRCQGVAITLIVTITTPWRAGQALDRCKKDEL